MKYAILVLFLAIQAHALDIHEFQTTEADTDFAQKFSQLNMNAADCKLGWKDSGTSVGLKVKCNGVKWKWVPENEATSVETQVVSYQLGRFLGMSSIVIPSDYYTLTNPGLSSFYQLMTSHPERNRWRAENSATLRRKIESGATSMVGVVTPHLESGSPEVPSLANPESNTINSSHPIAKFIRAGGPQPSAGRRMGLGVRAPNGATPTETELELARQFSQIMVLDILTGQWDRWSGGNIECSFQGDTVFFISRDNGGASMTGPGKFEKYSRIVSRFDRAQIERLSHLVQLLKDPNEAPAVASALKLKSSPRYLLERAQQVLKHVDQLIRNYGESEVYFPSR